MGEVSGELWQELSGLADAFAEAGRKLLNASRRLHAPGVLPPDELIDELGRLRTAYDSVRERTRALATRLGVPVPDPDGLDSLKGLAELLDAVSAAEERLAEEWARYKAAVAVLDRVLRLRHARKDAAYPPLAACQAEAAALRERLRRGPGIDLEIELEVAGLAENDHPFAYLLTMVEGCEGLTDDLWESLFESVGNTFGRALAAATARGRIVLGDAEVETAAPGESPEQIPADAPFSDGLAAVATVAPVVHVDIPPGSVFVENANPEPVSSAVTTAPLADVSWDTDELFSSVVSEAIPFLPRGLASIIAARRAARAPKRKSLPKVERLERVSLMSCNVISGHVYLDANDNGLLDPGELPVAGNPIELRNSSGVVVGQTATDASGYYSFSTDSTISTAPKTVSQSLKIGPNATNFSSPFTLDQFDPSLGELTAVTVTISGSLTSDIEAENTGPFAPDTITATVAGELSISAAGLSVSAPLSSPAGVFDAAEYDGVTDFQGTSGTQFGPATADVNKSMTFTAAGGDDLSAFLGTGQIPGTFSARSLSNATGGGNLVANAVSTAVATVTVTYTYTPQNCLAPGDYTIVQTQEPPGTLDGLESSQGVVLDPQTTNPDRIPVTLVDTDLTDNNFGELLPAGLSGFVYVDVNNDGVKDPGEPGIPNTTVNLTGTDDLGQPVSISTQSDGSGAYEFADLRPGTYAINEVQPASYLDGKDTIGSQGGQTSNDRFFGINLGQGEDGVNNNFGEVVPASLSGFVYYDKNDDGVKEAGEPGIEGVNVALTGTNDLGQAVGIVAKTDSNGAYSFNGLRPGTYQINEFQPSGYLDGKDTIGTPGGLALNDRFSGVVLNQGVDGVNNNFGELLPGALNGYVYVDSNGNGLRAPGEVPLKNVRINLSGTDDLGQPVSATTTTNASGFYQFTGLRPGTYTVTEPTQPAGFTDGRETRGNLTPLPNSVGTDVIPGIVVVAGETAPDNNFGESVVIPNLPECDTLATVEDVQRLGIHRQPTTFVVKFNTAVDPRTAEDVSNYQLVRINREGKVFGAPIPITSATYDARTNTVVLVPQHRLNIHGHYRLTISGILDACEQPLDGDDDGKAGGDYVTVLTKADYPYPLPAGPSAHVQKAASWAVKFPRLAAERHAAAPAPVVPARRRHQ